MHALGLVILVQLLHAGLSLPQKEEIDLNPQSSAYDHSQYLFAKEVNRINRATDFEKDIWEENSVPVVVFNSVSPFTLKKICGDFELNVHINEDDVIVDCTADFDVDDASSKTVVKRDLIEDDQEGSGNSDGDGPEIVSGSVDGGAEISEGLKAEENAQPGEKNDVNEEETGSNTENETGGEENKTEGGDINFAVNAEDKPTQEESKSEDDAPKGDAEIGEASSKNEDSAGAETETKEEENNANVDKDTADNKIVEEDSITETVVAKIPSEEDLGAAVFKLEINPPNTESDSNPTPDLTPEQTDEAPKSDEESKPESGGAAKPEEEPIPKTDDPVVLKPEDSSALPKPEDSPAASKPEEIPLPNKPEEDVSAPKTESGAAGFEAKEGGIGRKGKTLVENPGDSPKEQLKAGAGEEPSQDQSTENTQTAGSKDTTILVFLFVAVVAVGVLAFGYNFIRKRRQQSADLERVERGPSAIKRSLQSLTKPENEQEMKPLINENSPKEQEMVELKKRENGELGENKTPVEHAEQTAKT